MYYFTLREHERVTVTVPASGEPTTLTFRLVRCRHGQVRLEADLPRQVSITPPHRQTGLDGHPSPAQDLP